MNTFAIGLPGQPVRMVIRATVESAALQLASGETFVEVDDFEQGSISEDGMSFIAAGPDLDAEQARIRATRTARLAASDWTQVLDVALSDGERQAWADYRQALRDLPQDQPCPLYDDVVWPEPPSD